MKKIYAIRIVLFFVVFAVLLQWVSKPFTTTRDYRNFQWIGGFYEEPENSLDAVYVGSSTVYASWTAVAAWKEHGITVYPYACNSQTLLAAEYLIKEVRKTQPNAVFIINLNTVSDETLGAEQFHYLLDYMPLSLNKLQMIHHVTEAAEFSAEDKLECYLPMVRYHDRWKELTVEDFSYEVDGTKGGSYYPNFLRAITNLTDVYRTSEESGGLPEKYKKAIHSLLDYCDKEKVQVLFVTVPRAEKEEHIPQINELNDIVESRGYPTLYLLDKVEEIGLEPARDFYNNAHPNIHGSLKLTNYISKYLIENYGFEDKRGNEAYKSWDEGFDTYYELVDHAALDIEFKPQSLTAELSQPTSLKAVLEEERVKVSWDKVKGADGYVVYRRSGDNEPWKSLDITTQISYADQDCAKGSKYTYKVVPYIDKDSERYYGKFAYIGVSVEIK